jgi:hypothetical protein
MPRGRPCRCCCRRRWLNEHGLCPDCAICLHCEKNPAVSSRGLCQLCHEEPSIRVLYRRSNHWTPEWELHLRRKTAEIQAELRRRGQ